MPGEPPTTDRVALAWSGGKDSALSLQALRAAGREPAALLTTVIEGEERVGAHGVAVAMVRRQAAAAGLPLVEMRIPPACPNATYEARFAAALAAPPLADVGTVAFGDLFLEEIRAYRREQLAALDRAAVFPLWGRDTATLAGELVAQGFAARLVCVDLRRLDASFAGRAFDRQLLADLPPGVDPCGEHGEFHTFVHAGPVFSAPIPCVPASPTRRGDAVFCDVAPA